MASAIDAKYNELIKTNPWIGKPVTNEQACPDKVGYYRHYEGLKYGGASIYWHPQTGAHLIYGLIRAKWAALGWEKSPLGYPASDEANAGSGKGRFNHFQNGTIIWKQNTSQAFAVYGRILDKWGEKNWDSGFLGFPVTDELGTPDGIGRFNHFEGGSIYWTPTTGAHIVMGMIREAWKNQGWEKGRLGYPRTDELVTEGTNGKGRYNLFEGGEIHWTPAGGTKVKLYEVNIEIWFSGFKCLNESNEISSSDEPYMFLGVSTSGQAQTPYETGVIGDVDQGNIIRTAARLYSGIAQDVILAVVIRENDQGDPNAYSSTFKSVLDAGNVALGASTGVTIPGGILQQVSNGLSNLLGAGDDTVGRRAELLTRDYLMQMVKKAEGGDPVADFTWDMGHDDEGIYRLYFFVKKV
ncbi:LGFP repeat-containing protein [Alkalinema pantanalense CENA528]|uniref:LGFP repeat-containing protein n=1 Tax=Alkalinema pantanalense TaxID=1620705 RepID=UPI003D6FD7F0